MSENIIDLDEAKDLARRFDLWGFTLRPEGAGRFSIIKRYGNETVANNLTLEGARAWMGAFLGLEPSPPGGEAA